MAFLNAFSQDGLFEFVYQLLEKLEFENNVTIVVRA